MGNTERRVEKATKESGGGGDILMEKKVSENKVPLVPAPFTGVAHVEYKLKIKKRCARVYYTRNLSLIIQVESTIFLNYIRKVVSHLPMFFG
jgi:hypothetical protein